MEKELNLSDRRRARGRKLLKKVRHYMVLIIEVLLTVILAFLFARGFCREVSLKDGSMEPTLSTGETYLINAAAYAVGDPERGDIIAYRSGDSGAHSMHIKRIVGLPGETVQITDGQIYIDGSLYTEEQSFAKIIDGGLAEDGVTLGSDEYFVIGDNRNGSVDSRYADVGNISSDNIVGKLWLRVSPLKEFGLVQ